MKPYAKMNAEQCWHSSREILMEFTLKLPPLHFLHETKAIICLPVTNSVTFFIYPHVSQHRS